jgi:hypothetical protein
MFLGTFLFEKKWHQQWQVHTRMESPVKAVFNSRTTLCTIDICASPSSHASTLLRPVVALYTHEGTQHTHVDRGGPCTVSQPRYSVHVLHSYPLQDRPIRRAFATDRKPRIDRPLRLGQMGADVLRGTLRFGDVYVVCGRRGPGGGGRRPHVRRR